MSGAAGATSAIACPAYPAQSGVANGETALTGSLIVLIGALLTQDAKATLEGCALEEGRWVCRYRLPEMDIVQGPPTMTATPVEVEPASSDPGVLSADELKLVSRCADAGWVSLCSKSERENARRLRDSAAAYEKARIEVGKMMGAGQCDTAISTALAGGYLGLAREARSFCKP